MGDDATNALVQEIIEKDIFVLLKAENLPQEKKDELSRKMNEEISLRVALRVDQMLVDNSDKERFKSLVEADDQEGTLKFFEEKGILFEKLMLETAYEYKAELVTYVVHLQATAQVSAGLTRQANANNTTTTKQE